MGKTTEKITEEMKQQLIAMYHDGKMDSEIAKQLHVSSSAIMYWRKKLHLPTKFNYSKIAKIDNKKFEKLFNEGLSDYAIANQLNMSPDGVYSHRMSHGYLRKTNLRIAKAVELTDFQKQVLLGTLLGDSSARLTSDSINTRISCAHGIKQKQYCEYKTEIFSSLGATCKYHKRTVADRRNGKFYEDCTMCIPANPKLNEFYFAFYPEKQKIIPFSLFKYFTAATLAFWFMDDGCKIGQTYSLATNCFNREELQQLRKFLFSEFNLETSLFKSNVLYIKKCSSQLFTQLISPYICESMKYKLQSLNSVNLGKPSDR